MIFIFLLFISLSPLVGLIVFRFDLVWFFFAWLRIRTKSSRAGAVNRALRCGASSGLAAEQYHKLELEVRLQLEAIAERDRERKRKRKVGGNSGASRCSRQLEHSHRCNRQRQMIEWW